MPPKVKVAKKQIVHAALDIATLDGLSAITSKSLSAHLGCSVAPIYVNFDKIDDLINLTIDNVGKLMRQYVKRSYTSIPFVNVGIGHMLFAYHYPKLYKDLISRKIIFDQKRHLAIIAIMKMDPILRKLSIDALTKLFQRIYAMTTGMCMMMLSDIENMHPADLISRIQELIHTIEDIIRAECGRNHIEIPSITIDFKTIPWDQYIPRPIE